MKAAILDIIAKDTIDQRKDTCGSAIRSWLFDNGVETIRADIIPDNFLTIQRKLTNWCDTSTAELIITCGGTGVSLKEVVPKATKSIIERELDGYGELMRPISLEKTPISTISKVIAGIRSNCLIINLPGTPQAALENLDAAWAAVNHGIAEVRKEPFHCANIQSRQFPSPPVVSFAGYSGSGKTTLAIEVIKLLSRKGYKVGAIKHEGHSFEIDKPGKDSWRMTQAGAAVTCISDSNTLALIKKHASAPNINRIISDYYGEMDIVIVEGWKNSAPNKIEVYRSQVGNQPLFQQKDAENFIAVATDCDLQSPLPLLDINQPQKVVDFIVDSYLNTPQQ